MAQLAIKGHPTRGKEVIQLLEMLGGVNAFGFEGTEVNHYYYIDDNKNQIHHHCLDIDFPNEIAYTIEKFLEKFPYKVGDEVIAYAEGCLTKFTIQDIRWNYELNKVEYKICSSWLDASLIMQHFKEELTMEKINIAELLKDCPKGMELDCTICNNVVTLCSVDKEGYYPINVVTKSGFHHILTCEGYVYDEEDAKCVIYPKGKTTWEGFQRPFKDGDILTYTGNYTTTFIYRNKENEPNYSTSFYVGCSDAPTHNFLIYNK
jgi:hypothetical protein